MAARWLMPRTGGVILALAVAALVLVPQGARLTTRPSGTGCVGDVRLPVIASVDKLEIVAGMAARFTGPHGRRIDGHRVCLTVFNTASGAVLPELAEAARKQDNSGPLEFPLVWIPASSMWWVQLKERTDRCGADTTIFNCGAAANDLGLGGAAPPSVAASPLVIAVPHFLRASTSRWRAGVTTWADLTQYADPRRDRQLVLGKTNPNVSTVGLGSALSMLWEAADGLGDESLNPQKTISDVVFGLDKENTDPKRRALAADAQRTVHDMESVFAHYDRNTIELLCGLPTKSADAQPGQVQVFPIEEQTIWTYNTKGPGPSGVGCPGEKNDSVPKPDDRLEPLFLKGRSLLSDHPYIFLDPTWARDELSKVKAKAASRFQAYLTSPERREEFQRHGFREPDPDEPNDRRAMVLGAEQARRLYGNDPVYHNTLRDKDLQPPPCVASSAPCKRGLFDRTLKLWATKLRKPVRTQVLLDISGSMADPTHGTGATKVDLATTAIDSMLAAFHEGDQFGLRVFSTDLGQGRDYKDIHPLGHVPKGTTAQRQVHDELQRFLTALSPSKVRGRTGLYDSIEASVKDMSTGCTPGTIGSLTVLSDGGNSDTPDDQKAPKLARLLQSLNTTAHGQCPVRVMIVAYGSDILSADADAMRQIATATQGRVYYATDPATLGTVLTDIIADF